MKFALCASLLLLTATALHADPRPEMTALRVPDGSIAIDGRDDDWQRFGAAYGQAAVTASGAAHLGWTSPPNGDITGPDDISLKACAATDSGYLYLIADVHDDLLYHRSEPNQAWVGDDFEVYLDANDMPHRFQPNLNENNIQFLFVAGHLNVKYPDGYVMPAEKAKGSRFASRLRPFGYTIEIAIPKAVLPNWAAHPDLDSVGFDIQLSEVDSPGIVGHDYGGKGALYLLQPGSHFKDASKEGLLRFANRPVTVGAPTNLPRKLSERALLKELKKPTRSDEELAQAVLDSFTSKQAGRIAEAAIHQSLPLTFKAGCYLYLKHPDWKLDPQPLQSLLGRVYVKQEPHPETVSYALVALAERHQLTAGPIYRRYAEAADKATTLTFLWCLGTNGDRSLVPQLRETYLNSTGLVQQTAALSLAALGDATGLPTLKQSIASYPGDVYSKEAARLVAQFGW